MSFSWKNEFSYDYMEEADILEVFFQDGEANSAVEIAEDVTLRFNHELAQPMSLIINNYTYHVEPGQFGPRGFHINLERFPTTTRETILRIIQQSPVNQFIKMLTYTEASEDKVIPIASIVPA